MNESEMFKWAMLRHVNDNVSREYLNGFDESKFIGRSTKESYYEYGRWCIENGKRPVMIRSFVHWVNEVFRLTTVYGKNDGLRCRIFVKG